LVLVLRLVVFINVVATKIFPINAAALITDRLIVNIADTVSEQAADEELNEPSVELFIV